jgi:prophage regulatory protein
VLLTRKQVCQLVGYSPEHVRRLSRDGLFPKPLVMNPNPGAVWSVEAEVLAWLAQRVASRDAGIEPGREREVCRRAAHARYHRG